MRKLVVLAVMVFVAVALLVVSAPATAHAPCAETFDRPGASDYGRDHIASHPAPRPRRRRPQPGRHRGYSACNPSGK